MFDHVTIRASDREASERFYDTVLPCGGGEALQRRALRRVGRVEVVNHNR